MLWYRYCIDCIPPNAFPIALVCIMTSSWIVDATTGTGPHHFSNEGLYNEEFQSLLVTSESISFHLTVA